ELEDPALEAAALLVRGQNEERSGAAAQAEATLRRAVERAELAEDHGTRAQALIHLVYILGDAKDDERRAEALAFAADAGAVLRVLAADPLLRAQLDNNLAVVAKRAGDLDDALAHLQQSLATYEELFGEQHPSTLRALMNLGNVLRLHKRFAEAETALRRASEGFELVLGTDHPFVAVTLSNLAITLAHQQRPQDAVPVFRRSLEIRVKNDPEHPDLAKAHFNLARALFETRTYDEALAHYEQGLELRRRAGADEDELVGYHEGVGQAAARAGKLDRAAEQLAAAVAIHEREGEAEPLALVRAELALVLATRDPERALALASQVREWLDARAKTGAGSDDRAAADQVAIAVMLAQNQRRVLALAK
ncbi:MAG TPA: tetratricopeptide repeat protein, partial [Nannocystaceae bacterium]|nr:tetratricopeptide repeat protein [Nannocystaceae bacterium]